MLNNLFASILFWMVLGIAIGYAIKWYRGYVKTTENEWDDLTAEGLVVLLKLADKYFDEPLYDNLFKKALEILEEEDTESTPQGIKLKKIVEKAQPIKK